jgi:hypothetical protein
MDLTVMASVACATCNIVIPMSIAKTVFRISAPLCASVVLFRFINSSLKRQAVQASEQPGEGMS